MSGITTTGATVLSGLDSLPESILFYRQLLQWMGGMGLIVLAIAVMPFVSSYTMEAMDWPKMLILGGALLPLATCFMAIGPRYITSAEVGLFLVLESIFAPILVWYVLGENPGSTAIFGGCIVLTVLTISNIIGLRATRNS